MKEGLARLKEIIQEEDKPYKNEEALTIALVEKDMNQDTVAEMMDCSAPTISNWKNKLDIGEDKNMERGVDDTGDICVRCETNETPDQPYNNICDECLDYVRQEDSKFDWDIEFSDAVINA